MNRQSKSAIKSLVLTLRHRLEDDIAIQLKRYGFAGERWLDLDRLPHLQRDDRAASDHFRLKAALEQHLRRIGAEPAEAMPQQQAEAVDWFVREVASSQALADHIVAEDIELSDGVQARGSRRSCRAFTFSAFSR